MHTLYCTQSEQKAFVALSTDVQKGWTVELELLTYTDTPERREFRFQMMRVRDPQLLRFREQAMGAKTEKAFMDLATTIDLKKVDNRDLTHIIFALGPDAMTMIIGDLLRGAKNTEDIELAAALSALRHGMLESFKETSHPRT